jgi:hypothetical protein
MISRRRWFLFCLAVIVIITITAALFKVKNPAKSQFSLQVIQLDGGWGYEILADNKAYISQKYIPAIEGNHFFDNKNDARKVGRLVLDKLQCKLSPTISKEDLVKLKILKNELK